MYHINFPSTAGLCSGTLADANIALSKSNVVNMHSTSNLSADSIHQDKPSMESTLQQNEGIILPNIQHGSSSDSPLIQLPPSQQNLNFFPNASTSNTNINTAFTFTLGSSNQHSDSRKRERSNYRQATNKRKF